MLKTQEVVNFVNEKLNELGTEGGYSFDIHSNIGENRNNGALNGILYINQGNNVPIPDYVENDCNFVVEILVPSARANKQFDEVQNIVSQFGKNYDGTNQEFDNGKGLLNITLGKPENFNTSSNTGENVPLYFTISLLYTENVKTSGDVHWLLDNMEIPYLNDEIFIDREGNVNKQYTGSPFFAETKTLLTSQTTMFRFVFPFKNAMAWNGFFVDLLDADIDREYELKYYDGYFYTQQSPYRTIVKVFKSAKVGGQRGKPKTFDVTFAKVDNGQTTTKYFMALIDNPFDNQTEDTMWFEDVVENGQVTQTAQQVQQAYFENKVASGCAYQQIKAPNLNSIDITSQIYPNRNGYDLFDTVNKNYAIIKVQSGTYDASQVFTPLSTRYFYYFVTNAQIGAGDKILFDLKLDTVQTYMFENDIAFSDSYIEKANLNRWVETSSGSGDVKFDGSLTSKLFEREDTRDVAKRLIRRTKVSLNNVLGQDNGTYATTENEMNTWLDNNVAYWVYGYVDPQHKYNFEDTSGQGYEKRFFEYGGTRIFQKGAEFSHSLANTVDTSVAVICVPVYKTDKKIIFRQRRSDTTPREISIIPDGMGRFMEDNGGAEFFVSMKISKLPPFSPDYATTDPTFWGENYGASVNHEIDANGNLILQDVRQQSIENEINLLNLRAFGVSGDTSGVLLVRWQFPTITTKEINLQGGVAYPKLDGFIKYIVCVDDKNPAYNPKLYSADYFTLKICNQSGDGFEYDLQKLNKTNFRLEYTEPFVADTSRSYTRIQITNDDGIYIQATNENFTGFVSDEDNSMALYSSAWQQAVAQQKNFLQQKELSRQTGIGKGIISMVGGIGSSILGGSFGAAVGISKMAEGGNMIVDAVYQRMQDDYTIDNMQSAPASIKNANSAPLLNLMTTEMGVYIELSAIIDAEKNVINDAMVKYGFNVNQIGQIMDYLTGNNKRHYFNFIKAQVSSISGIALSNVARADFRQRFANGLRFWKKQVGNTDFVVDYDKENYEEWISPF